MITIMQSHIPRCPECSSSMTSRVQDEHVYFYCEHCLKLYRIIGNGQIDNEILISDNVNDCTLSED